MRTAERTGGRLNPRSVSEAKLTDSNQTCFDWPSRLRAFTEPGLSSCVADGRLTLDGRRVAATVIDLYALRLVEWALARRQSIIICPPEPFGPLPVLAAAAAHIASITQHYERTGQARGSDQRVAVVTSSARLRGIYRRLGIGTAPLFDVAPAAIRSRSGAISILGRDPGRGWSTIFVSTPAEVTRLANVDIKVIELPLGDGSQLDQLAGPLILIAHDPADPLVVRLARDIPVFAWTDDDLGMLRSVTIVDGPALVEDRLRLERAAAGVLCTQVPVQAQRICENAALFWEDIGPLLRASRRSLFGRELTASAFVLFYDLMHLAMPTDFYESTTYPLRVRVREIEAAQRLVGGDLRDLYVPMVAAELSDLVAAIGPRSPKSDVLLSVLREHATAGEDVLLVARTGELARAYRAYIDTVAELDGSVRVTNLWGVAGERPADVAVIVGLLPTSARYMYTTGIAAEIVVLGYEADATLESVPDGFTEHRQIRRAIAYQREYSEWLARDAAKSACWATLSGEPTSIPDDRPDPPRVDSSAPVGDGQPAPPDAPPGLWDASLGSLERRLARDVPPRLSSDGEHGDLEVEALHVGFTDGRWMYIDAGSSVTRWRSAAGGSAEAGHPARRISPGDELVLLDGETRKDLLAKVLEIAEDVPELAVPAAWVDYWRDALRRAHAAFGTYERLHADLEANGCVRQAQTVRLWVIGQIIGPEDPEDVRRLGQCLEDAALIANYQAIADAMKGLRRAHVRLGQRLGALARHVGPHSAAGLIDDDEIIDARSGLTASDFRDSVEILEVESVHPVGRVPYAVTGLLRPSEEKEAELV
jgi:hypothetical protein